MKTDTNRQTPTAFQTWAHELDKLTAAIHGEAQHLADIPPGGDASERLETLLGMYERLHFEVGSVDGGPYAVPNVVRNATQALEALAPRLGASMRSAIVAAIDAGGQASRQLFTTKGLQTIFVRIKDEVFVSVPWASLPKNHPLQQAIQKFEAYLADHSSGVRQPVVLCGPAVRLGTGLNLETQWGVPEGAFYDVAQVVKKTKAARERQAEQPEERLRRLEDKCAFLEAQLEQQPA